MDKHYILKKFGKGYGYLLNNKRIQNIILDKLEKYYRLKLFIPFGKTYKVAKTISDLKDVQNYDHLVNFKIGSNLSYLYLMEYNGIKSLYYIIGTDRNQCQIYSTLQRFDGKLFRDETLFEGYILSDIFLVEDIIVSGGHTVNKPLEDRIRLLNNLIDYKHRADPVLDNFQIVLKDYVDYKYISSFTTDYLNSLVYRDKITGIVFSALGNCPVHIIVLNDQLSYMTQLQPDQRDAERLDLVNSPKKTQACFLVRKTDKPDVYHLYLSTPSGDLKYYDIATIPDRASSVHIKGLFKDDTDKGLVMICKYDKRNHIKRWQPIMISNREKPDTIFKFT